MKVGDIVKIKENLEARTFYGDMIFTNNMKKYRGRQAKITNIKGDFYHLDIDDGIYAWTDDMLESKEEIKMKVGDVVKIKENLKVDGVYGSEFFTNRMEKYRGKQARITNTYRDFYSLDIDDGRWNWTDDMLEPISSKRYEVIVEGNTVIVKDDKGNEGIAKCSPEDEFNLSTGISLAISRLKWKPSFGEIYYSICFTSKNPVSQYNWQNDSTDNILYVRGLVFKTREEAEETARIMLDSADF